MHTLSSGAFQKARAHIFAVSDDVNRAWFRYNFEGGDSAAFLDVLAGYQHENGGFGGLVYEFEYQGPCLKCTEHAFRYLFYMKERPPAAHPMIRRMMEYVLARYRPEAGCWGELLEPEVNDGAHVPWWGYSDDENAPIPDEDERILRYRPNGQAALAAFVALYRELVPEALYREILRCPVEKLLRYYDTASPLCGQSGANDWYPNDICVPYNLKCYHQFVSCLGDKPLANRLKAILLQQPTVCMNLDKAEWTRSFENAACEIVGSPASFLYPAVAHEVAASLDFLTERLEQAGGVWRLGWRLGEGDAFDRLQAQFEAHLTMLYLALLRRFDRIEQ